MNDSERRGSPGIERAKRAIGEKAYRPGPPKPGVRLKLDANEAPPPPARFMDRLNQLGAETFCLYPNNAPIEEQIAAMYGVDPARVVVTAGLDDALSRLMLAYSEPGRRAVITDPTFSMIPHYVRMSGVECVEIPWHDGPFPSEAFASAATPGSLALCVTPNNPTGLAISTEEAVSLARSMPDSIAAFDLAYVEFADENPAAELLNEPNAVVLRTMSKAWGMAGLRVGYAIAPEEIAESLRAVGQPFAVSRPAIELASFWLAEGREELERRVAQARSERDRMHDLLRSLGVPCTNSEANFAWMTFADEGAAIAFVGAMLEKGIAVRRIGAGVRISCPIDETQMDFLLGAIREAAASVEARA